MDFATRLLLLVVGTICRRYFLPFIIITALVVLGAGWVAALSGGAFGLGARYALAACSTLGALALVIGAILGIKGGLR